MNDIEVIGYSFTETGQIKYQVINTKKNFAAPEWWHLQRFGSNFQPVYQFWKKEKLKEEKKKENEKQRNAESKEDEPRFSQNSTNSQSSYSYTASPQVIKHSFSVTNSSSSIPPLNSPIKATTFIPPSMPQPIIHSSPQKAQIPPIVAMQQINSIPTLQARINPYLQQAQIQRVTPQIAEQVYSTNYGAANSVPVQNYNIKSAPPMHSSMFQVEMGKAREAVDICDRIIDVNHCKHLFTEKEEHFFTSYLNPNKTKNIDVKRVYYDGESYAICKNESGDVSLVGYTYARSVDPNFDINIFSDENIINN